MRQLLALAVVDERDAPMNPRLIGKPVSAKPRSPMPPPSGWARGLRHAGDRGHAARGPDRAAGDRRAPLAALRGLADCVGHAARGVAILDEGNRMSEKSWASWRRCSTPGATSSRWWQHQNQGASDFRLVATMNDALHLRPARVHPLAPAAADPDRFSGREEELAILRENCLSATTNCWNTSTDFLQLAHGADERYTVRDGINVARYAMS